MVLMQLYVFQKHLQSEHNGDVVEEEVAYQSDCVWSWPCFSSPQAPLGSDAFEEGAEGCSSAETMLLVDAAAGRRSGSRAASVGGED